MYFFSNFVPFEFFFFNFSKNLKVFFTNLPTYLRGNGIAIIIGSNVIEGFYGLVEVIFDT